MNNIQIMKRRQSTGNKTRPTLTNSQFCRSSDSRISSLKTLSIKNVPFSEHIYHQQTQSTIKVQSANDLRSEKWNFDPHFQRDDKFLNGMTCKPNENPFFKARMSYQYKQASKLSAPKRIIVDEVVATDISNYEETRTTFRAVKKRLTLTQLVRPYPDGEF